MSTYVESMTATVLRVMKGTDPTSPQFASDFRRAYGIAIGEENRGKTPIDHLSRGQISNFYPQVQKKVVATLKKASSKKPLPAKTAPEQRRLL